MLPYFWLRKSGSIHLAAGSSSWQFGAGLDGGQALDRSVCQLMCWIGKPNLSLLLFHFQKRPLIARPPLVKLI